MFPFRVTTSELADRLTEVVSLRYSGSRVGLGSTWEKQALLP